MESKKNIKKGKSDDKKEMRKILFKNNIFTSINSRKINTLYINTTKQNNVKIINKRNESKREQILNTFNHKNSNPNFRKSGLPPLQSQQSLSNYNSPKNLYKNGNKFSFNIQHFEPKDKEGLIVELYHITNDMDIQNKEIENLTKDYNNLINNCLAYKIIIEKILGLDENGNYLDEEENPYNLKNREKSKSENNFKNINSIDEKEEYRGDNNSHNSQNKKSKNYNTSYITTTNNNTYNTNNKKNKNKFMKDEFDDKENQTKINVLLKQKNDLNKSLIHKTRYLIGIKNKDKNKKFDEFLQILEQKNFELENLVNDSQQLQYEKYETESQITTYILKLKKVSDEIISTGEKIKINKKDLENNLKDIQNLTKCNEELKERETKLKEEIIQNKNNFKEKKEKENKIDNLLKEKSVYFSEKEKIELQIKDLQKQEDILKKSLDKKNLTIKQLTKENDDLSKQIKFYESKREKLLEKADQPRKNRIKMKDMENEIKDLEKNIVTYKVENDEKEKNMEETIEKNNDLIANQEEEINNHPNIVKDLEEQINNLKNEIKNKEENNNQKGEELNKIEEEFNKKKEEAKIEREKLEKIKKEKEMKENSEKEMKNKQNEEKYNEFLKNKEELMNEKEKLKEDNSKIKEENKILKKLYKEKMDLYKLAIDKQLKLKKILEEISNLSNNNA